MMRLSTATLSLQRPAYLSVEFDGDDGKFSPFKWLEHRWEVEGIKNRAPAKKLQDALSADRVRCKESENAIGCQILLEQ
ncbi:Translational repressor ifet-1, partial [Parelaphostrongylus tenuis]